MLDNLFSKTVKGDFVIIDSQFPQKEPMAFRNAEINEYLSRVKNSAAYAMYPMMPGPEAWFDHGYGVEKETFESNLRGYLDHYPENKQKIHLLDATKKYSFTLAYCFFLAETYTLLPFLEKNNIPFVFVLYPGGSFGLNNKKSDEMLKKIFSSQCFRSVIVTQKITKEYLERKKLCPKNKISYVYGGFVQFKKENVKPKKIYPKDKKTFDICFVAAKYSDKGRDKGYDIFIKVAKLLCSKTQNIRFHVIGGFDKDEIDTRELGSQITFYGYKKPAFLADFYSRMDIFLGPGRPFALYPGNFDGFPLGIDAAYCGVALFVSDELNMNRLYKNGEDIKIIDLNSRKIADLILQDYNNPDSLYKLARKGMAKTQQLFDIDHQVDERISIFKKYAPLKVGR